MKIKTLDAIKLSKVLPKLFAKHEEIYLASAWGYNCKEADSLFAYAKKFKFVIFGVSFCQTDPDLLDRLINKKNSFIAESTSATFHPKLYYFRTGNQAEAIIGSSNFTRGGLKNNFEANVYISGKHNDPIFGDILDIFDSYKPLKKSVTKVVAERYRLQYNKAKKLKKAKNPVLTENSGTRVKIGSKLANMKWHKYASAVKSGKFYAFSERLELLRECQRMFASVSSFADLSLNECKAIAGVIGEQQKKQSGLSKFDWGWFGSMKGMGDFANRIAEKDKYLAKSLDAIPRHGEVEEQHYNEFCKKFLLSFKNSDRTGSYPTATRLLAMKRPDVFVCICKPNIAGLANALGFAKSTLRLDNYWQKVIEPIQLSPWYNKDRPIGKDAELWDGRVAMLDAIYYDPNTL